MRPNEWLRVVPDAAELARAACAEIRARAQAAIAARGVFHLALAGGSTPRATYEELARRTSPAEVEAWQVWFGDERCVPREHPDSNHGMAERAWLHRLRPEQVERMRGEAPPAAEAARYEARLVERIGPNPTLDMVLLGLGADGHTASLFPGTPALTAPGWVTVGHAPKAPTNRLTLTLLALSQARLLCFLVSGADKALALKRALDPAERRSGLARTPAALVTPNVAGELLWLVDQAAAPSEPG